MSERTDLPATGSRVAAAISSMKVHWTWSSLNWLARPVQRPRGRRREGLATDAWRAGDSHHRRRLTTMRHPGSSRSASTKSSSRSMPVSDAMSACDHSGSIAPPAGERGGDPNRRDRVTEIVLAVAERAFAVLPRLAPMDRGQRDEPASGRISRRTPVAASNAQRRSSACRSAA